MNNLKISWEVAARLQLQSESGEELHWLAAIDVERDRLFFASTSNFIYTTQNLSPQTEGAWSKTSLPASAQLIDLEAGDCITCLEHVMEKEALLMGTSYGLLLLYNMDDNATEIVGRVEGGVRCISLSPDGDLFGMVTGFQQILVMNLDWDLLYEMTLDDLSEDIDVHELASSADILFNPISWRGDGKFFSALSKVHDSFPSNKKLKVWERDSGALHAVSEPRPFMGSVLDWIQSGGKIAAVYDRSEEKKCPSIVLFEKNGLERSSFSINEGIEATIDFLRFNCNSDLLAATVRNETYDTLKIWFFSNNHWYLKQEIRYSKNDKVNFMWDPTKPLRLISWTLSGQIISYKFVWVTAVRDNSTAFVIDGSKILVTPLLLSLIPPPMYCFSLEFPSAVRDMTYCSKVSQNRLAASLSNGGLSIVELPLLEQWDELEGNNFKVEASYSGTEFGSLRHLSWLDSHVLLGVSYFGFGHSNSYGTKRTLFDKDGSLGYYLLEIEISCSEDRIPSSVASAGWHSEILNQIHLEGVVIGIAPVRSRRSSAFIQFNGGKLSEYISKLGASRGASLHKCDNKDFLSSCPQMDIAEVGDFAPDKLLLFGLDDNGRLHIEGRILCNNCGSFSFYSNSGDSTVTHLVIATKKDLLFIVDFVEIVRGELEQKYENFMPIVKSRKSETEGSYINIWERGAQVVGVLHGDESAIILQTPRGNLECVYPRKLVLASIVNSLGKGHFRDALLMVRRHRIDFNIIVDHCGWQTFVQLAADFVKQVRNLSYITEFVCGLKNINIMETLYKNHLSSHHIKDKCKDLKDSNGDHNKVNSVLMAIRKALEENIEDSPSREISILTTLAKNDPPALEQALGRVKLIREMELCGTDDSKRMSHPSSEEALKHLLWLSDSEAVFEAALGLYDLNLAAIVALNSQKDPKEFLPLLEELEKMPMLFMKYNIDLKLRRYESALRHIFSAGDPYYKDFTNLMMNVPELYPLGLQLIDEPDKKRQILEAWGDHLISSKNFEDAATTYLCCFNLEKALKAYRACGNWKGVLTVAGLIKFGKVELLHLARELCEELQALGKLGDAAKIVLDYCGDINNGISLLVRAREWEEALRIAFLHQRDDLVSVVKSSSLECASLLIGEYSEGMEKAGKYLTRYLAVRQRRLILAATIQSDERSVGYVDDETASQASTTFSGMSAYTTGTKKGSTSSISLSTSARGRGRQRNRGKIRAGSPSEEMALVEHLKAMSLSEGAKCELKSLLTCLVILGEEETARKLQRGAEKFQVSQIAAVKLTEDAMPSDSVDEYVFLLERYIQKVRKEPLHNSEAFSWMSKVLL